MRYCLFDGGDVVGPFTVKQLLLRTGFGPSSLVCPEENTADGSYWKEAYRYEEFGFEQQETPQLPEEENLSDIPAQNEQFSEELDNAVRELASLEVIEPGAGPSAAAEKKTKPAPVPPAAETPEAVLPVPETTISLPSEPEPAPEPAVTAPPEPAAPAPQDAAASETLAEPPAPEIPAPQPPAEATPAPQAVPAPAAVAVQTVSTQASPIEEYFNTMKSGDLGNILGIPDTEPNSDLDLAKVLEKQLEKTDPQLRPAAKEDPFAFLEKKPETQPADSVPEVSPDEADRKTQQQLQAHPVAVPVVKPAAEAPAAEEPPAAPPQEPAAPETLSEPPVPEIPALQEPAPEPPAVQPPVQPAPQEAESRLPEPDPEEEQAAETLRTILAGTLRMQMNQPDVEEPIKQVDPAAPKPQPAAPVRPLHQRVVQASPAEGAPSRRSGIGFVALGAGIAVLLAGALLNWMYVRRSQQTPVAAAPAAAEEVTAPVPVAVPTVVAQAPAAAPTPVQTPEEVAKEVVQNYTLDGHQGTVAQYLAQHYAAQLAGGYEASWSAELLHRDTYVVKYRLAKTRQEPVVYIFQVDTAKKKLTGALNNITLDLVGKINS